MHSCSVLSRASGEPLAGTAPHARLWVVLEQPGPWGRDALTSSHLDPFIAQSLNAWVGGLSVRLALMRRPGHHPDRGAERERVALIARTDVDQTWLWQQRLLDVRQLLDIDLSALLSGSRPADGDTEPVLLVCTNARRDLCCAVEGRVLAANLHRQFPGQVWETTHLGGHRFAPTFVSLPDGFVFGGPHAGEFTTDACRGRSSLSPDAQAVELAALQHFGYSRPTPLRLIDMNGGTWSVHAPGAEQPVTIAVTVEHSGEDRPESCGRRPVPCRSWVAKVVG